MGLRLQESGHSWTVSDQCGCTCVHMRVYGICTICAELMRVVFRSGGAAYMRTHELTRVVFGRGDTSAFPKQPIINTVYPIIRIVLGTLCGALVPELQKEAKIHLRWLTRQLQLAAQSALCELP